MGEPIAITAFAERTALSSEARSTFEAIFLDDQAIALAPIEGFDASGFGDVQGAQIWKDDEEPEDDPANRILGPHGRLFDALIRHVHEDAGLQAVARERLGLFAAMPMVDAPIHDLLPAALAAQGDDGIAWPTFHASAFRTIHPLWPLSMLGNVAVGQVSIELDIRGDNVVLAADATSGVRAFLEAARALERGACDAALVGAVSGRIRPSALARQQLAGDGDVPLGEGGAAFVLEREADAEARGATVLARLVGGATAYGHDASRNGANPEAIGRAVQMALERGGRASAAFDRMIASGDTDAIAQAPAMDEDAEGWAGWVSRDHIGDLGPGTPAVDAALALQLLLDPRARAETPKGVMIVTAGRDGGVGALALETDA